MPRKRTTSTNPGPAVEPPPRAPRGRPRVGTVIAHEVGGELLHYDVRITFPDGERSAPIHLNNPVVRDKAEARRIAAAWSAAAARGEIVRDGRAPAKAPAKLAEIAPRWVELVKASELAPATKALHEIASRVVVERFGTMTPAQLTGAVLRAWLREMRTTRSASRTRNIFNSLGKMLDDAAAEGWHDAPNACRLAKVREELPALPDPEDDAKARHTEDEAARLCFDERIPWERRLRYLLAFTTGMRDGEIAGLRWTSLVVEHGLEVLRVRDAVARYGDGGWATRRATKTKASRRTIPLHPATVGELRRWRDAGWRAFVGRDPGDEDPILPGPDGSEDRPRSAELLRRDLETIGLPTSWRGPGGEVEPFEFRSTRRSFATWLEAHDVPGDHVDRLLGHAATSVRRRHYSAGDLRALARAVETIRLAGASTTSPTPPMEEDGADASTARSEEGAPVEVELRHFPSEPARHEGGRRERSARKLSGGGGRHAGAAPGLQSWDRAGDDADCRDFSCFADSEDDEPPSETLGETPPPTESVGTGVPLEVARELTAGAFELAAVVVGRDRPIGSSPQGTMGSMDLGPGTSDLGHETSPNEGTPTAPGA